MKKILSLLSLSLLATTLLAQEYVLTSPDGKLSVTVDDNNGLTFKADYEGVAAIMPSPLGIYRDDCSCDNAEKISSVSAVEKGLTAYDNPIGKVSKVSKEYVQQEFTVEAGKYALVMRVYNNGVAFAYRLFGTEEVKVYGERTAFALPKDNKAFLTQLAKAKSGWQKTNPSYEDPYHVDVPLTELSEHREGWIFPALFHGEKLWTLISETGTTADYVACHLSEYDGEFFHVEFPTAGHNLPSDPTWAELKKPGLTPWRTIVVSDNLADIVENTLSTDLVEPLYAAKHDFAPGKSSWSWIYYGDDLTTYDGTKQYIDLAAQLGWNYCLVDAVWDKQIGREKIAELAQYAQSKNVGLILWYNSNGNWNTAPQSPFNCMNTHEARQREMAWMKEIGVVGIKTDFFGGDKQAGMKLYEDILRDANDFGIGVNFHGATLPRGWERMYPAFLNAEAVMGQEFCRGEKDKEANRASHATILPFVRNAVAPMDFTPVVLNSRLGPGQWESDRTTTTAFELAMPVIFFEPITHFGITPSDIDKFPQFVWDYFRHVPTVWDETRLLGGYPGKDVVIARRSGSTWYVAGINGDTHDKAISVDLSFIGKANKASLITSDSANTNNVMEQKLNLKRNPLVKIPLKGKDGFVIQVFGDELKK